MSDQQSLPFGQEFKVGDVVWWTHGLGYLVATYRHGDKIRPESCERVRIESVDTDAESYSRVNGYGRSIRVYSFDDDREYTVSPRWLSPDPKVPCEAVLQAYGVFL